MLADRLRALAVTWCGAILVLTLCVAIVERGAFFQPANDVVLALSLFLVAGSLWLDRSERPLTSEDVLLLALAGWWFVTARYHHAPVRFMPLGTSIVGFLAGLKVVRLMSPRGRSAVQVLALIMGLLTAVVGLVACDLHWYPVAMRGNNIWRLSGTLTYANAAGVLLALALVSLPSCTVLFRRRADGHVALLTAGLVATESRAALLAVLLVGLTVMRRQVPQWWRGLTIGVMAGAITVAGAATSSRSWWAPPVALLLIAASYLRRTVHQVEVTKPRRRLASRRTVIVVGLMLVTAMGLGALTHRALMARLPNVSDLGRAHEWRAAWAQFTSSPWVGVGPDVHLNIGAHLKPSNFVHNEYLQILAGGGLIAGLLLLAIIIALVRRVRRHALPSPSSAGVLLVLAVGGALDFTWHLPAIGLYAGTLFAVSAASAYLADDATRIEGHCGPERSA